MVNNNNLFSKFFDKELLKGIYMPNYKRVKSVYVV
jgi:hypothetical protein